MRLSHSNAPVDVVALWKAAKKHDKDRVQELLLKATMSLEVLNFYHPKKHTTPLMAACLKADKGQKKPSRSAFEVIRLLIEFGADPVLRDKTPFGYTALHYAAMSNQSRSIELLMRMGADPFALNCLGHAPIDFARWEEKAEARDMLTQNARVKEGWLEVKREKLSGLGIWKKRFCVVLACDPAQSVLEFAMFRHSYDFRPVAILLLRVGDIGMDPVDPEAKSWSKRPNTFTFDRPVVVYDTSSRTGFSRHRTSRERRENTGNGTATMFFAAENPDEQAQWMSLFQRGQATRSWPPSTVLQAAPRVVNSPTIPYTSLTARMATPAPPVNQASTNQAPDMPFPPISIQLSSPPSLYQPSPMTNLQAPASNTPSSYSSSVGAQYHSSPVANPYAPASNTPSTYSSSGTQYQSSPVSNPYAPSSNTPSSGAMYQSSPVVRPSAPTFIEEASDSSLNSSEYSVDTVVTKLDNIEPGLINQRSECVICMDAERNAICVPCGHVAGCYSCLHRHTQVEKTCPICRSHVQTVVKIYEC
ncbi:hypothetical protein Poli38472_002489 [Pythium oligandrum]|uniref:Uncharacterized protein n=1 Tax=Pythium oligandrum TaxID=41045 RepID=A0A8K1CJG1_PYTOL|nr:hypothetical protein Poli38472_002489 [Pythium oligandrum]|eukprot:TMW63548.1 hypothetical protein Poli38472_002489 [Pythium oligandrum]